MGANSVSPFESYVDPKRAGFEQVECSQLPSPGEPYEGRGERREAIRNSGWPFFVSGGGGSGDVGGGCVGLGD